MQKERVKGFWNCFLERELEQLSFMYCLYEFPFISDANFEF